MLQEIVLDRTGVFHPSDTVPPSLAALGTRGRLWQERTWEEGDGRYRRFWGTGFHHEGGEFGAIVAGDH